MSFYDLTSDKIHTMLDSSTPPSEVLLLMAERVYDRPDEYRMVLARGADINARNLHGATPLITLAATSSAPRILPTLIQAGANINAVNLEGETALMMAVKWFGGTDTIKLLLKAGAKIEQKDKLGRTAVDFARENRIAGERQKLLEALGRDMIL